MERGGRKRQTKGSAVCAARTVLENTVDGCFFSIDSLRAARGMIMRCAPLLPRLVGLTHDGFQEEFRLGLTWVEEERARRRKAPALIKLPCSRFKNMPQT